MAIPLQAPTVEVQREEYGAVEVESVLTVGLSNRRMTVECVAFNLVGVSSDTFTMEVSGECPTARGDLSHADHTQRNEIGHDQWIHLAFAIKRTFLFPCKCKITRK